MSPGCRPRSRASTAIRTTIFDSAAADLPKDRKWHERKRQPPHPNRPQWLPGGDKTGIPAGTNMTFGTLRYGKLLEAVMYDYRRFVNYNGRPCSHPPALGRRLSCRAHEGGGHHALLPCPVAAVCFLIRQLGDWYPDLLDAESGRLVLSKEKAGWQRGWFAQHQRLIEALAAQIKRTPVILQGDFHATAAGKVTRSGELALKRPIEIVMSGTLGSGDHTFPSSFRSVESKPSQLIGMDEAMKPTEKNGFCVIDVTPEKMTFSIFTWRPPQPVDEIDTMKPALVYEVARKA